MDATDGIIVPVTCYATLHATNNKEEVALDV